MKVIQKKKIRFPDLMERCVGFTIPKDSKFYIVSYDFLIFVDMNVNLTVEIESNWDLDIDSNQITVDGNEIPLLGVWGGVPISKKKDIGQIWLEKTSAHETVILKDINGQEHRLVVENLSGDWETLTFDEKCSAFLYGTPYDFDCAYFIILDESVQAN